MQFGLLALALFVRHRSFSQCSLDAMRQDGRHKGGHYGPWNGETQFSEGGDRTSLWGTERGWGGFLEEAAPG